MIDGLEPVERELRFALPYWALIGVLVSDPDENPEFEGRPTRRVVLTGPQGELTSAHVGARIERFRTQDVQYLVDRHPELRRFLRTRLEILDFSPGGALDIQQDAVLFRKPR